MRHVSCSAGALAERAQMAPDAAMFAELYVERGVEVVAVEEAMTVVEATLDAYVGDNRDGFIAARVADKAAAEAQEQAKQAGRREAIVVEKSGRRRRRRGEGGGILSILLGKIMMY